MKLKIRGISIDYEAVGQGMPAFIIHGFPLDRRLMMSSLEPVFKKCGGFRRIYIDLPGMGRSAAPRRAMNADQLLSIVVRAMKLLCGGEKCLLVGFSYGGYLAQGIAYQFPDAVDSLILICPVTKRNRDVPPIKIVKRDGKFFSKLGWMEREMIGKLVVQTPSAWRRFKKEVIAPLLACNKRFTSNLYDHGYYFWFDVSKFRKKFKRPALILSGRHDPVVGYEDAEKALKNFPEHEYHRLETAGHHPQIETPKEFERIVKDWLIRSAGN